MTTHDWHSTYRNAVETFNGQTPGPELEQLLLDEFQHSPQTVIAVIAKAEQAWKTGRINSPWGIVRTELGRISSQPHVQVTDTKSASTATARAETWIRHTGLHLHWDQVLDTLFAPPALTPTVEFLEQLELETQGNPGRPLYGPLLHAAIRRTKEVGQEPVPNTGGPLTDQDTPNLRNRLHKIWENRQPLARQLEHEAHQRDEAWKAQQEAMQRIRERPPPDETLAPEEP